MDEPTTGMDAAVRKDFYRIILKAYMESPRTIIISSHHLDELEDILVIAGGVIPDEDIPYLKSIGIAEVFTPGASTQLAVEFVKNNIKR
jgi:methylmalonyl-CoA mutase cobalamin-binding domain/chain